MLYLSQSTQLNPTSYFKSRNHFKKQQNTSLAFLPQQIDTKNPGNPRNAYLEIYDGLNEQAIQISKLNGNLQNFNISSTENCLFIKFETFEEQGGGFIATINYGKHIKIKYLLIIYETLPTKQLTIEERIRLQCKVFVKKDV